jgi:putative ABC transport system substrate-binding protein
VKPFRISNFGLRNWPAAVLVVTLIFSVLLAPFAAGAQQPPLPVIGYLKTAGLSKSDAAFLQGLSEIGYSEGRNVIIERRSAEGHYEWLPALASELVGRHVAVIVTGGGNAPALAAKGAVSSQASIDRAVISLA